MNKYKSAIIREKNQTSLILFWIIAKFKTGATQSFIGNNKKLKVDDTCL